MLNTNAKLFLLSKSVYHMPNLVKVFRSVWVPTGPESPYIGFC